MYKAMIIDDEEIVRWGIRDLIDWESEGFELCEDGVDGRDGLKKLLANEPDLVLVDIKMPGISGIELIRLAREAGAKSRFVILTGYSEFEFAKAAVSLGVEEYLLKPVDEDELADCVQKVQKALEEQAKEVLRRSSEEKAAKEKLFRKILLHIGTKEELERQMLEYQISFDEGSLCVAILADAKDGEAGEKGFFDQKRADFLKGTALYQEEVLMDDKVVLVSNSEDYRSWAGKLSARNERIKAIHGTGLLIAIGNNVGNWYELHHSYELAKSLLEQEFLLDQYDVLSLQAIEEQQKKTENPPAEYFLMLIEVGDLEGIREGVEKFRIWCVKNRMTETDVKVQVLYNLMSIRNSIEKKYGVCEGDIAWQLEELNGAQQLGRVMELYDAALREICINIEREGSDTVIRRMYYYMEKNYSQEMKLESFARMFNYNANYLGRIFKKEIGDSFNNILDSIRIANAKRLLEETDRKVYQISEQVGYRNIDYFYMKFRKYVGVSPKEYQKEISEGKKNG